MKLIKRIVLVVELLLFLCIGCKKQQDSFASENVNPIELDTILKTKDAVSIQDISQLQDTLSLVNFDFKAMLNSIKHVKHSGAKHKDWMTNNNSHKLSKLFRLDKKSFFVSTTSYTYKQKSKFYLHTLQHVNDTISMLPYLKNAIGKRTRGYMQVRVLFFAMKDSLKAHFIDIPPNYGYSRENNELIRTINKNIDVVFIACDSMRVCEFKDFRK